MNIPETLKVGGIVYKVVKINEPLRGNEAKYSAVARHGQAQIDISLINEDGTKTELIRNAMIRYYLLAK